MLAEPLAILARGSLTVVGCIVLRDLEESFRRDFLQIQTAFLAKCASKRPICIGVVTDVDEDRYPNSFRTGSRFYDLFERALKRLNGVGCRTIKCATPSRLSDARLGQPRIDRPGRNYCFGHDFGLDSHVWHD